MKKLITALALATTLGGSFLPNVAYAEEVSPTPSNDRKQFQQQIKDGRKEFRQNIKDERKNFKQGVKETKKEFKFDLRDLFKNKKASEEAKRKGQAGHLSGATITAISSNSLTVKKDQKTYTITISSQTKILRHFWGKSKLSEFSVDDKINVWGKWTDDTKTTLDALVLRNLSIMKRHGVFFGEVSSLGSNSFVIKSINRGDQTVLYGTNTKFEDRRGTQISASDTKVGNKIRVKGLWDKANKKITEVEQVKNFSFPTRSTSLEPTAIVTVTTTAAPTLTVTPTP
jgi:hypothetical protein